MFDALSIELIKELATTVPVPLVLHGSSGVSDPDIQKAVQSVEDDNFLKAVYALIKEYEQAEPAIRLTAAQKKELNKRWDNYIAGKTKGYSVDEAKKMVKALSK